MKRSRPSSPSSPSSTYLSSFSSLSSLFGGALRASERRRLEEELDALSPEEGQRDDRNPHDCLAHAAIFVYCKTAAQNVDAKSVVQLRETLSMINPPGMVLEWGVDDETGEMSLEFMDSFEYYCEFGASDFERDTEFLRTRMGEVLPPCFWELLPKSRQHPRRINAPGWKKVPKQLPGLWHAWVRTYFSPLSVWEHLDDLSLVTEPPKKKSDYSAEILMAPSFRISSDQGADAILHGRDGLLWLLQPSAPMEDDSAGETEQFSLVCCFVTVGPDVCFIYSPQGVVKLGFKAFLSAMDLPWTPMDQIFYLPMKQ